VRENESERERERELIRERDAEIRRRREEYGFSAMSFQQRSRKKRPELAKALLSPMADLCNPIPFFSFFFYKGSIFLLIFVVADLIFLFLI
jgi:hypothetical protein